LGPTPPLTLESWSYEYALIGAAITAALFLVANSLLISSKASRQSYALAVVLLLFGLSLKVNLIFNP
jgi:hypothetical protein